MRHFPGDSCSPEGAPKATIITRFENFIRIKDIGGFCYDQEVTKCYLEFIHQYTVGRGGQEGDRPEYIGHLQVP